MYGVLGDEDLEKSYDGEKMDESAQTPRYPKGAEGYSECRLNRVTRIKTKKSGKMFEFKFTVVKTDAKKVLAGKQYTMGFFPGDSDVKYSIFWRNITPLLMAIDGYSGSFKDYNAIGGEGKGGLGELLALCADDEEMDLDMPFAITSTQEPCRPGKDGKVKHLDEDGNPKIFRQDQYDILVVDE